MISQRIQELRHRSNMSQSSLAKKLNITRSSVNAWEMGISVPSTNMIVELAHIFRVSTDYILLGNGTSNTISIDDLSEEERSVILSLLEIFRKQND